MVMDKEQLLKMNPVMLVSIVNMKLRDQFNNLESYCEDLNIDAELIENKINEIGYVYNKDHNQFIRTLC